MVGPIVVIGSFVADGINSVVGSMVDFSFMLVVGLLDPWGLLGLLGLLVGSIVVIVSIVDDDTNSIVGSAVDAGIVFVVDDLTVVDASVAGCVGSWVDVRVVGIMVGPVVLIGSFEADGINLVVGSMVGFSFM